MYSSCSSLLMCTCRIVSLWFVG
uniref:Uncharacterized protein n=1 Tax=Rhizophora mucronata TaxID=61149 RepID=A0A2P2QJY0_RHIMU